MPQVTPGRRRSHRARARPACSRSARGSSRCTQPPRRRGPSRSCCSGPCCCRRSRSRRCRPLDSRSPSAPASSPRCSGRGRAAPTRAAPRRRTTCGPAIDVPLKSEYAVSLELTAERTFTPGATTSGFMPVRAVRRDRPAAAERREAVGAVDGAGRERGRSRSPADRRPCCSSGRRSRRSPRRRCPTPRCSRRSSSACWRRSPRSAGTSSCR